MMQKYGMILHKRVEHTTAGRLDRPEESPGFTEAWQLLTAAGGDPRDSATEIDRHPFTGRQGWKGEVRAHQRTGDFAAM